MNDGKPSLVEIALTRAKALKVNAHEISSRAEKISIYAEFEYGANNHNFARLVSNKEIA
ncbi:hypothetical protein J4211_03795 [Candidatus Woesearchaeota archaeon]|nr:hypothetical protein [Candidatus Woesearchaeota archaeon]